MERVYNFSPGPAVIPFSVLEQVKNEMFVYGSTGMNVMEMSHRSKMYLEIFDEAVASLKRLMNIPDNYKVLFLQGGATAQFSMVPLNLYKNKIADYVLTGDFAKKAAAEAKRYGKVNIAASSEKDGKFTSIPDLTPDMFTPDADYVHITTNNTIFGTRYTEIPDTGGIPLVADMSSNILAEVYDVTKFGLIYAGAQKNIGPAGLTIVIIREDLIGNQLDITPACLNYKIFADNDSMPNTPTTYSIYIAGLVFKWLESMGGVPAMQKINEEKAALLYKCLDESAYFNTTVEPKYRSMMNVVFRTPSDETDDRFVKEAAKAGLVNLKGHRSTGGIRASIYNAMPVDGVRALVEFMKKFETVNK
jgi:phosphoserine aminotransferase